MKKRKRNRDRFHIRKDNIRNGIDPATTRKPSGKPIQSTEGLTEQEICYRGVARHLTQNYRRKQKGMVGTTCFASVSCLVTMTILLSHTILIFFLILATGARSCG